MRQQVIDKYLIIRRMSLELTVTSETDDLDVGVEDSAVRGVTIIKHEPRDMVAEPAIVSASSDVVVFNRVPSGGTQYVNEDGGYVLTARPRDVNKQAAATVSRRQETKDKTNSALIAKPRTRAKKRSMRYVSPSSGSDDDTDVDEWRDVTGTNPTAGEDDKNWHHGNNDAVKPVVGRISPELSDESDYSECTGVKAMRRPRLEYADKVGICNALVTLSQRQVANMFDISLAAVNRVAQAREELGFKVSEKTKKVLAGKPLTAAKSSKKPTKERVLLRFAQKLEVSRACKTRTQREVADMLGVSLGTVNRCVKAGPMLERHAAQNTRPVRRIKHAGIDKAVWKYCVLALRVGRVVRKSTVQKYGLQVAKETGVTDFKASEGWLEKFLRRHKLVVNAVLLDISKYGSSLQSMGVIGRSLACVISSTT